MHVAEMPVISRFYGILITIYYDDHPPPHFHARYGSFNAKFEIRSGALIVGDMPARARAFIEEWRARHVDELMANWELAEQQQPLKQIEPLR